MSRRPKVEAFALTPAARLHSNTRPHIERDAGPTGIIHGAAARKFRHETMLACGCRLCSLALNPPLTFAEYEACGLSTIRAEHDAMEAALVSTLELERAEQKAKAAALVAAKEADRPSHDAVLKLVRRCPSNYAMREIVSPAAATREGIAPQVAVVDLGGHGLRCPVIAAGPTWAAVLEDLRFIIAERATKFEGWKGVLP